MYQAATSIKSRIRKSSRRESRLQASGPMIQGKVIIHWKAFLNTEVLLNIYFKNTKSMDAEYSSVNLDAEHKVQNIKAFMKETSRN